MRKLVMGCAVAAFVVLSPCSEARPSGAISILYPISTVSRSETGIASWYGQKFQGNPTASGEIYDMNGLTAAHRELPMGTKVKVTNLINNKSVMVRINDRGPAIDGRLIDVSMAAAKAIGMRALGLAPVRLEIVSKPTPPTSPERLQTPEPFRAAF
ncbi:MAG: septal ring lytic transglycosylase RlpA family protein [Terriglobia bacterium]